MLKQNHEPRVVVITGGTAGVGRAIAQRFAKAGDRLGLISRDKIALEETRRELEELGGEVAIAAADVADPNAVFEAAAHFERDLGPIDIWVNDAMETVFSPVAEMTAEEFHRVTEVTYLGFVYGSMAALKFMRPRRRGKIIQIGSALAYRGIPLQSAYCGAKHAIRGFTDSLRTELLHDGSNIQIAMVDLPAVNTPQFDWARVHTAHTPRPMGKPIEPEVVADAVFEAARGKYREYWLGGDTLLTILGNTILPGFLDHYLARKAVIGQQTKKIVSPGREDNLETPVTLLHRTRGSFTRESANSAMLVPGEVARVGVVAAGAAIFLALGMTIGASTRSQRRPTQSRRRLAA
jgi:NAD(P)-dependent dehydrogenase (short-subunit alcohol dehydrogenase family)